MAFENALSYALQVLKMSALRLKPEQRQDYLAHLSRKRRLFMVANGVWQEHLLPSVTVYARFSHLTDTGN